MLQAVINTTITFIISGLLGYCVSVIKNYKKKLSDKEENEKVQNMALLTLMQNTLTNIFFVYDEIGEIPDYIYKNFLNLLSAYEALGGDDYIHTLAHKMESWKIIKTDIL